MHSERGVVGARGERQAAANCSRRSSRAERACLRVERRGTEGPGRVVPGTPSDPS